MMDARTTMQQLVGLEGGGTQRQSAVGPALEVRYSSCIEAGTPAPSGFAPSNLPLGTGAIIVDEPLFRSRGDLTSLVRGADDFVRKVAAHLPAVDHEAEARVDAVMADYDRSLQRRPIGRRQAP
jgi:hypothetical protein